MPFTRPRHTQGSNMQHGSITTQPITGVLLLSPRGQRGNEGSVSGMRLHSQETWKLGFEPRSESDPRSHGFQLVCTFLLTQKTGVH